MAHAFAPLAREVLEQLGDRLAQRRGVADLDAGRLREPLSRFGLVEVEDQVSVRRHGT